jgi:hypothetical protein
MHVIEIIPTRRVLLALIVALAAALFAGAGSAHAAGPSLALAFAHSPQAFERIDGESEYEVSYTVAVGNEGDAATVGAITVQDSPPPQLELLKVRPGVDWDCPTAQEVDAGTALDCTRTKPIAAGGESLMAVELRMRMSPSAPDPTINSASVSGGGAPSASASDPVHIVERPNFEPLNFEAEALGPLGPAGGPYTLAGGHPEEAFTNFEIPLLPELNPGHEALSNTPVEYLKDAYVKLPPGFLGNPAAVERCPLSKFQGFGGVSCPPSSQVGVALIGFAEGAPGPTDIYNVAPEPGYPAEFAFKVATNVITLVAIPGSRAEGYPLYVAAHDAATVALWGSRITLFGTPTAHNGSVEPERPFLSNPVDCSRPGFDTDISIDSWIHPARKLGGIPDLTDPTWKNDSAPAPPVSGCSDPALADQWTPTVATTPVSGTPGPTPANQPTGLKVHLHFDQSNDPTDPANIAEPGNYNPDIPQAPELKTATVALPEGLAISPSGANGLGACSDQASSPAGDQVHYDTTDPVTCPDASKIGTVTATSPLIARRDPETDKVTGPEPLRGDVYILAPHPGDLPVGGEGDGKYRLLIQIENKELGVNFKLPGVAVANKDTGQLTATFTENPQLPVKDLELDFFKGERAALSTPKTCGTFTTTTDLEAWSAPGTPNAHPQSSFDLGAGSGCAPSLGQRPFNPSLSAGTTTSKAGSSAPFVLNLTRGDSEQEISSLNVNLPPGLTAKLPGVPYCSEAAIAAAKSKSGAAEQESPSCPSASQVGTLTTSAGPGSNPYTVSGKAYLSGPYKGAPLSFAFITPAVAGPFDLGNVAVRAAAFVDPETTRVTVKTDPIPQILDGVPLGIRSIQAKVDRPDFTLNPTNCEAMAVGAQIGGSSGASASPSTHFQVGDCGALAFKPKLSLKLKGGTARGDHPALKATLRTRKGDANIARTVVALPHSEFLAQNHIRTVCTRVQFAAGQGNGAECPKGSIYGRATAITPLLDQPLSGPVYLRSSSNPLPDLVAALHGQIDVDLVGSIDSKNGGIRTTFDPVPDAPVTRFVLNMQGGKKGLLENSRNLCKSVNKATARFDAQNGRRADLRPVLGNGCKTKHGKAKRPKRSGRR